MTRKRMKAPARGGLHAFKTDAARYTHVATNILRAVVSPLDRLTLPEPSKKKEPQPAK